jgi:uncharacterized protein (TIGR02246 family)
MPNPNTLSRARIAIGFTVTLGGLAACMNAQQAGEPAGTQIAMLGQGLPQSPGSVRTIASDLNAQRSAYYLAGDLNGLTSLYTPDATYIQLSPQYDAMKGRDQIRKHIQQLIDAKAGDIVYTVTTAEIAGPDAIRVGGNYYVTTQTGQRAYGHFTQLLRRDGGVWKIASHTFARAEPITATEIAACGLGCRTGFFGYH